MPFDFKKEYKEYYMPKNKPQPILKHTVLQCANQCYYNIFVPLFQVL